MRLEVFEIRDDDGEQFLGAFEPARRVSHAEHADFTHERRAPVMRLDVIGKNLLDGREFDHVLLSTDDVKMAIAIEASEIAGTKPSFTGEGFAVRFRVAIVTRHDDGAANQNFADAP